MSESKSLTTSSVSAVDAVSTGHGDTSSGNVIKMEELHLEPECVYCNADSSIEITKMDEQMDMSDPLLDSSNDTRSVVSMDVKNIETSQINNDLQLRSEESGCTVGAGARGGRARRGTGLRPRAGRSAAAEQPVAATHKVPYIKKGGRGKERPGPRTEDFNLGMIEELPADSPLEVPQHLPKRRRIFPSHLSGYWVSSVRDTERVAGGNAGGHAGGDASPTPGPSGLTETAIVWGDAAAIIADPPSPAVHVECPLINTPRGRALARQQSRRLRDEDNDALLQYGSEEEEEDDSLHHEDESLPILPRAYRMFFEADVTDTTEEANAAGRVEVPEVGVGEDSVGEPHFPSSLFDFQWRPYPTDPLSPRDRREQFVGNSGPMMEPTTSPYEIFTRIWDRPIMEHIVTQTNKYAQQMAAQMLESGLMQPRSRITHWVDTTVGELYIYFAIILAMGVVVKSKMEEYWTKEGNIFQTPYFSTHMMLRRFQLLNRCIHFNDNSLVTTSMPPGEAKIFKVAPVVDHLNSKFSSLYSLHQNVALDESLTQWKGWLNIKQYIPNKKAVVGIKTYEVCDSITGYLWRFEVHAGAEVHPDNVGVINGGIPNLVLRLLRGLEHSGRTIWMDNYYNSPSLARVLKTLGLDCVGTLRTNRQLVPSEIADLKKGDMRVGHVCGCTSGDVDLIMWRDQNLVAMISTYHGIGVSDGKPIVVRDYNVCMGGVDRKDQMLSTYPIERKRTAVWYKKFFKRLLNVSVLNAYIIGKAFNSRVEHREFRKTLILELLQKHSTQPIAELSHPLLSVTGRPILPPGFLAHLPEQHPFLPGSKSRIRRNCALCKIKRSIVFCPQCDKTLCFGSEPNCYKLYHSA